MLYLTTGGNGAGKTLLTLRDVREKSVKEGRPVVHNGRFEVVEDGELAGWKKADFKDWQAEPDGTIFIVDECHNEMPTRKTSEALPEYIRMLAEHRRRGFDFYLITQHPLNIDSFVRRLIASPGYHRHLKRVSGAALVSVLTWPAVNDKCEKNGAGSSASTAMVTYPKEVYKWYRSTSLDTAKVNIPFQAKLLVLCLLLVPVLGFYAYKNLSSRMKAKGPDAVASVSGQTVSGGVTPKSPEIPAVTPAQYVASYAPRLEGLSYTASRYDDLTKPTEAPRPAACVKMANRCQCYTQQATKLVVPETTCLQIVKDGYFQDWGAVPVAGQARYVGSLSASQKG
jgi:zona occludens toxin